MPARQRPTCVVRCMWAAQLDVTFPGMPCGWLSLDAMDVSGEFELDVDHDITKRRLSAAGVPLDDGEKHKVPPPPYPPFPILLSLFDDLLLGKP